MAQIPEYRPYQAAVWRGLWYPARVLAAGLFRYRAAFDADVPDGPLVIAANHLSHVDPPIVGIAVRRPTRFLALDELWSESTAMARILGFFGAIPLPREGRIPIAAMREALAVLAEGGAVGVFPESRRVPAWGDEPPRRGAAWLAVRSGAPLLPVALWGTERVMPVDSMRPRPAPVSVRVGAAIDPANHVDAADPVASVTEAWRRWMDEAMAAGESDR